jgi:putative membrane protein
MAGMNALLRSPRITRPALLASVAALVLAGATTASARIRPPVAKIASVARPEGAPLVSADNLPPAERTFLVQAVEAARREWRLAQFAAGRATSSDVRSFAQQLASDDRQITDALEGLMQRKSATGLMPPDVAPGEFDGLARKAGADFDRELMVQLGASHEKLLKLFEQVLSDAKDADVRDLAGTYLPMVRAHLNRARALQKTVA